jgi:hypothetical protein
LTSRSFTIPGGKSGGRLFSRSGRYTPQADLPFFDRASARHMQSCSVSQVAQCDLRSEFRGKPRQAVRALPRALAATDAAHNKGIEGEAVAIVHALACSLFVPIRQAPPVLGVSPPNQSICPVCAKRSLTEAAAHGSDRPCVDVRGLARYERVRDNDRWRSVWPIHT